MPTQYATLDCTKDTTIRYTIADGTSVGTGADFHNVVGRGPGDYIYRTVLQFDINQLPADVYNISSAVIRMRIAAEAGPASPHGPAIQGTPTVRTRFITKAWTEGTTNADAGSSGWSTTAPTKWSTFASGGANTFTGTDATILGDTKVVSGYGGLGGEPGTLIEIDVRDALLAWAPNTVVNGQGISNYGVLLYLTDEGSASNSNRVNFMSNDADPVDWSTYSYYPNIYVTYSTAPTPDPTVTADSPKGTDSAGILNITNLSDARIWTDSSDYAQGEFRWTYVPASTQSPIALWRVTIYQGTSSSGPLVYDSGNVTDSAHLEDGYLATVPNSEKPSWLPSGWQGSYNGFINGQDYAWYVYVKDDLNQADTSSVARFKARWGQALYEFDAGSSYASTSSWLVDYDTPPSNTQAVELYQATNVRSQAVITNITAASGTITFTCAGGHSFVGGDKVTITGVAPDAYNLTNVTVNATGLTSTAFTVTNAATGTFVTGTQGYATLVAYEARTATVSNVTAASGTVTYTTSSNHGFVAGQRVTITGVAPTSYNLANVQLATASGSSFTVTNAATGTFVSGGTAVMHGRRGVSAPITDISGNGSTITYTGANNFSAGQQVTISGSSVSAFNSSSAIIASATLSSFTVAGATSATYTIASLTATGTAVTYTTTANHGFSVGQLVVVAGCTPSGYNTAAGGSRITAATNTTFTIDNATTGSLTVAGTARVIPTGTIAESVLETSGGAIAGQARYCHAYIRTSVNNAASSTQPVINNVQFTYLSSTQTPDYWASAGSSGNTATTILDSDTRRFGTKSVRITSATAGDAFIYPYRITSGDDIAVVPNTIYTFSSYIKVGALSGANNVRLRVYPGGTSDPSAVSTLADSGPHTLYAADNEYWRRLSVTFTTGSATHTVRPMIYMPNSAGVANDYFWADGILFEEGTVVRSWTPGFVTSGVTFEGGGLNIDTSRGGVLRLRGASAGARDQISVGANGLLFGGDTSPIQVYSGTAGQLDIGGTASASAITTSGKLTSSLGAKDAVSLTSTSTPGITFGSDTNIYRSATGVLTTDGAFTATSTLTASNGLTATSGAVSLGGTLSLAAFTLTGAISAANDEHIPETAVPYASYGGGGSGINGSVGATVTQLPLSATALEGGDSTYFSVASNQITVKSAGIYLITLNVKNITVLASNTMRTQIRKGGVAVVDKADYVPASAANAGTVNECIVICANNTLIDFAGAFSSGETAGANKMAVDRASIVRIGTSERQT